MFQDMECLRIDVRALSEWDAALWVRARVQCGTKTAGQYAKSTLILAEKVTGEKFHAASELVKAQASPLAGNKAAAEPPKPAVQPKWTHIMALEEAIKYGKTPQQRIMAGFFVFLVHSSHRCSNGQGSRNLRLTPDALMGEAMLKGKKVWTKWVASRMGVYRHRLGAGVDERARKMRAPWPRLYRPSTQRRPYGVAPTTGRV